MLYTTYCGYVDFLMVVMFVVLIMLFYVVMMLGMLVLTNMSMMIVSLKMFNFFFFGDLEILLNVWGVLFLFMVIMISSSVMIFSFSYMNGLSVSNFVFLYLSFVISMAWLVLSNNFYWMMFGWDGLGVVSFLLIVFYMSNESITNGLFTLFQNRIGDLFFVLFILGVINLSMNTNSILKWGLVFLVLGSGVKSAQFPFNSWLLAAMSAPTPISSLVHSSTLVVAGVYIMLQYSYCLYDVLDILKYVSLLTLIISSFGLINESDMKKLIAYSTMSHVSLMMYMLSFKLFKIVYFHLNIHAMFKSLMFMCFGFVMLASYHSQDKRLVSVLNLNPIIKMIYYFSCLCLAGLPFLSGFFSKDLIIEKLMEFNSEIFFVVFLLLFLGISIYYSMKLLMLTNVMFSYSMVEKSVLGMISVTIMMTIMILIINVYISLVFSLSFEIMSYKMSIYFLVLCFFLLSVFSNLNFKLFSYSKLINFSEIWKLDLYKMESFMYWNIFSLLNYVSMMSNLKLFLLMNWWVMILVVVLF